MERRLARPGSLPRDGLSVGAERDRHREPADGDDPVGVGHHRRRATRRSRASRPTSASTRARRSASRSRPTRPPTTSTSTGSATTAATARARSAPASITATLPQSQPARSPTRPPGLDRLRQLGGVGALGRAGDRGLGHLHREADAQRHAGREPHRVRRARRREPLRPAVPDLRRHVAGVQRLRRQQPLRRHHVVPGRPRGQGQLQPAVHDPRRRRRQRRVGGLAVQRRVPDGALARGQRLRRHLHDRTSTPTGAAT